VRGLIAAEAASGTPSSRVVLAGFSQGAALALYTALTVDTPVAAVAALSGYLPLPELFTREALGARASTRVFVAHGDADEVVEPAWGAQSAEHLRALGLDVSFHTYHQLGHGAHPRELADLSAFLASAVPQ
jgi:phospholipase/carboxylesterase